MSAAVKPAQKLKSLISEGKNLILVGASSPIEVLMMQAMGYETAYLSGAALSLDKGILDEGLLSLKEIATCTKEITRVAGIPLIVDCDTGLRSKRKAPKNDLEELDSIRKMTLVLERAGAAAIQIEDQVAFKKRCGHLPGKEIVSVNDMFWKIRIASFARKKMLIIARTDARSPEGLDAAIWRVHRYINAGADIIFPEALESLEEFRKFRREVPDIPLMANLTTHGKTPETINAKDLFKIGYQIVLFPVPLRILLKKYEEILKEIKWLGSMRGFVVEGDILSRDELNEFIKKHSKVYKK